jgi:fucose permease
MGNQSPEPEITKQDLSSTARLTAACSTGMFIFGIVMAILGAILPELFRTIKLERIQAGNLFFFMNLGMLMATLFFGPVVDRFGFKLFLAASALLVGLSFTGLAFSSSYSLVLVSVIFLGLAGGGLNGGSNALVNDLNPEKRASALNFLGIFFGFGALFIPLIIGGFLHRVGLRSVVLLAALLSPGPFLLFSIFSFPRPKQPQGFPLKDLKKIIGSAVLWLGAFILFFQSGNEFSVGGWLSSFFHEKFHLSPGRSAFILSGYWLFLMLGRLLFSQIIKYIRRETIVLMSAALSLFSIAGLILSPGKIPAIIFALLVGLGFAAIYPTTLSVIGEKFPLYSGTAFSLAIGTGLVGGMLSPWLIGRISQSFSLSVALFVPAFNALMILALQTFLKKKISIVLK